MHTNQWVNSFDVFRSRPLISTLQLYRVSGQMIPGVTYWWALRYTAYLPSIIFLKPGESFS
jgi:hypothetical protein